MIKIKYIYYKIMNFIRKFTACEIPLKFIFNGNIRFAHAVGVVVSEYAKLGNNLLIYQNVTIGGRRAYCELNEFPIIEDNVIIYANVCIIGNVNIGKNCIIGAVNIITKDVPDYTVMKARK